MNQEQAITASLKTSRVVELESQVRHHRNLYYNSNPEISDADFDAIEDELREVDPKNEVFSEVGAQVKTSHWDKVKLPFEAGSLKKAMNPDELRDWVRKTGYTGAFVVSAKMDGASSIEKWHRGYPALIATRGDGKIGEAVTDQFDNSQHFPDVEGHYRAECVISKENFNKFLAPKGYKNARNSASSLMRSPKADREDIKHLDRVYYFKQGDFEFEQDMWIQMEKEGLKTAWNSVAVDVESVIEHYNNFLEGMRDRYEYVIDGLCIFVNSRELQQQLGVQNMRPRFAIALKFPSRIVKTVIERVEWQLGPSGRFTPVGYVTPVSDGEATIKKTTLHNMRFIRDKGIQVGSVVEAARMGDVIPGVIRVLE